MSRDKTARQLRTDACLQVTGALDGRPDGHAADIKDCRGVILDALPADTHSGEDWVEMQANTLYELLYRLDLHVKVGASRVGDGKD
ncbi:hypothetical protein SAMN04487967_1887 [Natronorubrum sediminis]|uniref:Uncharacterized protein n=1 Tax=Natronorubrum sediminis TaxID=640943 RepID=A0A1H6FXM7_9EURY|nr:hypothetical protein SAMN04487967_1887 [Natronorubrum sediminis]